MKITTLFRQLSLLSLVALVGRAQVTIDFDTYVSPTDNEFVNNFTRASTAVNQVTTGGVTGGAVSGFVTTSPGDYARYNPGQAFTSAVSVSVMFKYDSSTRDPFSYQHTFVGFGLSNTTVPNYNVDYAGFTIESYPAFTFGSSLWPRGSAPSLTGGDSTFYPVDGHWYQFTTEVTKVGGPFNQLNLALRVDDYGASGTTLLSTELNAMRPFSSATWMGDAELYAMFGVSLGSGFVAADNFAVSAIPEPSTYAAMAGAMALLGRMVWRRRQRMAEQAATET